MEQSKEIFVDFALAMKALQKRCVDACTGSMFLISDKDHGAIFSLAAGRIVDISYRSIRGPHALRLMREIKATKFFFKDNPSIAKDFPAGSTLLPENNAIFKVFAKDTSTEKVKTKNGKILVVEDSAMARKALVKVLNGEGYETVEAADGFEALGKLGEESPDLVLLDLILPKMDGYAVLAAMKKDHTNRGIPVIVLTSRDALLDKLKGKMSGTNEYLTKPIQAKAVIEKVNKYLDFLE